ncbi:MAG: hypothetical protein H6767_02405 [Candidatus Peribacteria bacterium]|nr:MAG: hypothetical protein H6767_02405 [Candidatus Peribacteria bacterium]
MQEEDDESDKFEMMMEALSGVVEDYLQRNGMTRKDIEKKKESIEKVEGKENTIDLR